MKIWSLPKHENLTTGKKILWKRGEIAPKEQFLLYSTILIYVSNFKSPVTHIFVKCGCFFLNSANLICRGTDILKYFRESLGIRDNESRLYIVDPDKALFSTKEFWYFLANLSTKCSWWAFGILWYLSYFVRVGIRTSINFFLCTPKRAQFWSNLHKTLSECLSWWNLG